MSWFQFGAITDKASTNIHVQGFTQIYVFISLGKMPKSVIAESYGEYFYFYMCYAVFQSAIPLYIPTSQVGVQFLHIK